MMKLQRASVYLLAASLLTPALVACGSDQTAVPGCPDGQVLTRAGCEPAGGGRDTGGGGRDTGGTPDTGTPDIGTPDVPDLPSECTPGDRGCASASVSALCSAEGAWEETACDEGRVCNGGFCTIPPEPCTPGETFGCASPTQVRTCAADGVTRQDVLCQAPTPNCVDGACSDLLCEPARRRCDGDSIVACAADGRSEEHVAPCEFGCASGACIDPCAGDGKNYLGCDFWATDLDNETDAAAAQFAVTLSNVSAGEVSVDITTGDGAAVQSVTIAPDALETVLLPRRDVNNSALTYNTYRITSDGPITAHQFNPLNNVGVASNDASLLLPATSVGTEYVVNGWPTLRDEEGLRAFVAIVAAAPGVTSVDVTSPIPSYGGSGVPALVANVTQTYEMSEGQVLSFAAASEAAGGFTGMSIVSSAPVAVFSGNECANVPTSAVRFCDHLEEQLFPVDTWGREFVGAKFRPRGTEADAWRLVAAYDGTTVLTNPVIPIVHNRTLGRGEYIEFVTDQDFVLTADQPISLAQFMVGSAYPGPDGGCDPGGFSPVEWGCSIPRRSECNDSGIGDPAFLINVPTAQFRNDYIVLTPAQYVQDFVTLIRRPGTAITMDGAPVSASATTVGGWEVLRIAAPDGVHRIEATEPIGLYAYGYDCDVSYAYPGGLNLDSLR